MNIALTSLIWQVDVNPEAPPGTEGMTQLINWFAWGAFIIAVIAFLIGAGTLGFAALTGGEVRNMKVIGLSMLGAVLLGAAGAIVGVLV